MGHTMNEQAGRDFKKMHLTLGDVKLLLAAYLILLIAGLAVCGTAMIRNSDVATSDGKFVIYCAAMSIVGSSIFYVRKLYKALINDSYTFIITTASDYPIDARTKRIGTLAYFVFRPIFGMAFSIVVYSLWRLSLSASGVEGVKPSAGFLYTTISLGFISGFLAGRLLTMLEGYGSRRLGGIMGSEE